jgi:hypothetical protein
VRRPAPVRALELLAAVVAVTAALTPSVTAQLGRRFANTRIAVEDDFDGRFHFCRIDFRSGFRGDADGDWSVDFPEADVNLSIRLSELTRTSVSKAPSGEPHNLVVQLTAPEVFGCPFIMMTEVGAAELSRDEITQLRAYLLKGGFLWADDFWGTIAWQWWESVIEAVLPPDRYPIVDLTPDHPLYRAQFHVAETPQIANIGHWLRFGDGMERGNDSPRANARAILDDHGRIMVLMTHNTDLGDSFEREGEDPGYFLHNSVPGYAFGINALLYAMTH